MVLPEPSGTSDGASWSYCAVQRAELPMVVCAAAGVAAWSLALATVSLRPKSRGLSALARSGGGAHAKNAPTNAAAGRKRGTAICMKYLGRGPKQDDEEHPRKGDGVPNA